MTDHYFELCIHTWAGNLLLASVQTVVPMLGVQSTGLMMTQMLLPLVNTREDTKSYSYTDEYLSIYISKFV